MKQVLFETDWLASDPVYYNDKTGLSSRNINEVIDYSNMELDPEGLYNFLDFGHAILEQTPVKDVKFLRYSSRLLIDEKGQLSVEYLEDPVESWLEYRLSQDDVIDLIRSKVRQWERSVEGQIVIPTSGGYDSRLLSWMIEDKSRIRSFSYGISENQSESFEVVYAKRLSEILGIQWEQIPLGFFHNYLDEWNDLYGVASHAHGMYHIEFYKKIRTIVSGDNPCLSGSTGDDLAGKVRVRNVTSFENFRSLGSRLGLNADPDQAMVKPRLRDRELFWTEHRHKLHDARWKYIFLLRFISTWHSYLLKVPAALGFRTWTPFTDIEVAMSMLNLPPEGRRERLWQKDFFAKNGLDIENMGLSADHSNTLNLQAIRNVPLKPLDKKLLREVVNPAYVDWINGGIRELQNPSAVLRTFWRVRWWQPARKVARLFRPQWLRDPTLDVYSAYLTLWPIEKLIRKRERFNHPFVLQE